MNTRTLLLAIQYASIMGLFFECWIIFKRMKTPAHSYLLISSIAALLNNTGYLLEIKSQSEEAYIVALKFSYLGRSWYAFFIFLFIAELTGFHIADVHKRIMMLICAAMYCVIFTIPGNRLYYTDLHYEIGGMFPRLQHGNGIVHHINMGTQFLFILAAIVFLFVALKYETRRVRKMCYLTLSSAIVIQAIFLVVQLTGVTELTKSYDVTMIGYFIGTIMMLIAILSFDLLGTTEMAKEFIIDRISEGIIAVDNDGVLQYINEPAAKLYPELQKVSIGQRKKKKDEQDATASVIDKLQQAMKSDKNILHEDRVYAPEENQLIHNGKQYGTLYALVDETEHIRYTEELEKQKEIADNASHAKSLFLANMSHEIRTPINAILGMDEIILRETTEKNIRSYAGDIKAAGKTLLSLINDILDLSKVEEGKMEIIPVRYELASLVNDLCNMIRGRAQKKGLFYEAKVDEHTPHLLMGDEIRIRQCVLNLLTNAVKYTESGSVTLHVGYKKTEDENRILLCISVVDTGIGMRQEDLEKLLMPYQRIEEQRNRFIEGTGLGMSITHQLLDLMGSRLMIESEYGKGTTMSFEVPQEVVSFEEIGDYNERYDESIGDASTYQESFHAPDARILVVDDTEMNLTVMENLLKHTQLQIDCVLTGKEAVRLAQDIPYDILFIDHMMSEMDGLETLVHIREKGVNTKTPAVVLTANAVSGAREQYLKAGFDEYLSKPVDGGRLEKMIISFLPKEKVMKVEKAEKEEKTQGQDLSNSLSWLSDVPEIDEKSGLKFTGSEEGYLSVLRVFHQTAVEKANDIEGFFKEGNLEEYTIRVHALKSSARIIGAAQLSKLAESLEKAGKEKDTAFIEENTQTLLSMYRQLDEKLSPLDEEAEDLPELSETELKEAYATISEIAQAMDFGMMDDILRQLHGYKLSEKDGEILKSLEKCFIELDWDDMIRIVKQLL